MTSTDRLSDDIQYPVYVPPKWEEHKSTIAKLYEKKELKDIMHIMKHEYGFKATENQYKKQISKWGLNIKHIKPAEYKFMLNKKRKRADEEGKDTTFSLHGREVPPKNIDRYESRMAKKEGLPPDDDSSEGTLTPSSLLYCTPSVPDVESERPVFRTPTMLQIPLRMTSIARSNDTPIALRPPSIQPAPPTKSPKHHIQIQIPNPTTYTFSAYGSGPSTTVTHGLDTRGQYLLIYTPKPASPSTPPAIDQPALLTLIQDFANYIAADDLSTSTIHSLLANYSAPTPCDQACQRCPMYGYVPSSQKCLLHQALSHTISLLQNSTLAPELGMEICRSIVRDLFPSQSLPPPLSSLLNTSTHLLLLPSHLHFHLPRPLATHSHIPPSLLSPLQFPTHKTTPIRPLLIQTSLILATHTHLSPSLLLLKTLLGPTAFSCPEFRGTVRYFSCQDLRGMEVGFESVVGRLTGGGVRVVEGDGGVWAFFDGAGEKKMTEGRGVGGERGKGKGVWYRDEAGGLSREELIVRATAVRALVEVEWWRRREVS